VLACYDNFVAYFCQVWGWKKSFLGYYYI
jgi:hypothetical protein